MMRSQSLIFLLMSCVVSVSQAQWAALNGPPGANVRDMEIAPNGTVYVVANLKLFYSSNNGDTWQALVQETPSTLDLEGIIPDMDAVGVLYGVNYGRFYKSVDHGLNWDMINTDGDFYGIYDVLIFGPDKFFAIYGWNGVYVSEDEGVSWTKIWDKEPYDIKANAAGDIFITTSNDTYDEGRIMRYPYPGPAPVWNKADWITIYTKSSTSGYDMKFLIDASSAIYAAVSNDVVYSANNGANWASVKNNIAENSFSRSVWAQAPDGTIIFTNSAFSPSKIYSTTNQGANWSTSTSPTDTYGSVVTDISFGTGSTIYLSSDGDGVFRSNDGGGAWAFKSSGLLFGNGREISVADNGRIIYLNNYRQKGYWTSIDNGVSWAFVAMSDYTQKVVKLSDGKLLLHSGGPVFQSIDDGTSFTKIADNYVNSLVEDGSGVLFGADYNVIYKSVDQGDTWTDLSLSVTGLPAQYYSEMIAINAANTHLFAWLYDYSVSKGRLYKIPVAGGAATLIANEPWEETNSGWVNNMFIAANKLYVAKTSAIYESSDEGVTWNTIRFSGERVFPIEGGLCVSRQGSLYITQDGGKSWNSSTLPAGNSLVWDLEPVPGGFVAAATSSTALKFTGDFILPINQLPPYIDFDWQPMTGPYGGWVDKVFSDNSLNTYAWVWGGRIFKTLDFSNWVYLNNPYVNDVIIDKPNNTIYGLTYSTLIKSTTGGTSWTTVNQENISCRKWVVRAANGTIAFSTQCSPAAIYVSTDGGVTFGAPKVTLGEDYVYRLVSTSASSALFAHVYNFSASERRLLRSKNNGDTWEEVTTPIADFQVSAGNNGNLYLFWSTTIYKSSDDGDNWVNISGDIGVGYTNFNAQAFTTPTGALFFAGYSTTLNKKGFWKTVNNGTNWTFVESDLECTTITSTGQRIIVGTTEGVYTTDDEGLTYTERSNGITVANISDMELVSPTHMISLSSGDGSYSTTDFDNWERRSDLYGVKFLKKPDGTLIGYGGRNFYRTEDNGETWTNFATTTEYIYDLATADGITYFATTSSRKIQYTNNFINWTTLNVSGLPASFNFTSLAVNSSGFVFVALTNYDNGYELEAYQILFGAAIKISQATDPRNLKYSYPDQKVLLYDGSGAILETADGSNWTSKSVPSGDKLFIAEKDYYFIGQYDGTLWLSRNKGITWQSVGFTNNSSITDIAINEYDGHAYASLSNLGAYRSGNIIIPPEAVAPVLVSLTPANNGTNVLATTTLKLTFDEVIKPVNGKKIRIVDLIDQFNPVEIIDASAGTVYGKSITFTPANPLVYEKTYFVVVDNGAFTDIFGNIYTGFNTNSTWRFTIQAQPDLVKPAIGYSHNSKAFTKGAANKLQISVTDDGGSGVDPASVKLHYRAIMNSDPPATVAMTNASGNSFEVAVQSSWLDELGMEYVFEARDNQGNVQYSPVDGLSIGDFHKGYILYPAAENPSLPSALVTSGGQLQNYRIFSIPYKLSDATFNTVFNELSGLTVKTDYRILHFNTESEKYSEVPAITTVNRGLGYWVNIKDPVTITIENASTPEDSKDQEFAMSLKPGWNQVGNPYPFTISWNTVRAANSNIGVLKSFNGSGWVEDDKINAFEGGFVLLNGASAVNFTVPFAAKTSAGRTKDEIIDFEGGWVVPLTIENSKFRSVGGVGMHPDAGMSFDQYDDAMPPKVFDIPEISFAHGEHFLKSFIRDVVPLQNEYTWQFVVDGAGENAVLTWDTDGVRSLAHEMYLLDIGQQKLINMAEEDHCTIDTDSPTSFRIFYGVPLNDIKPSRITLGKPYPNPFVDRSNVTFTLPENPSGPYNVSLDVYDNLGKRVTTLARGAFNSGFYTAEWLPEPGTLKASMYLYRLTVSDTNSNITLAEKIIIQK